MSADEWRGGGSGLIGENQLRQSPSSAWDSFDWDHFIALVDESRSRWRPLGARTSGDDEEGSGDDPRLRELRRTQTTALTSWSVARKAIATVHDLERKSDEKRAAVDDCMQTSG